MTVISLCEYPALSEVSPSGSVFRGTLPFRIVFHSRREWVRRTSSMQRQSIFSWSAAHMGCHSLSLPFCGKPQNQCICGNLETAPKQAAKWFPKAGQVSCSMSVRVTITPKNKKVPNTFRCSVCERFTGIFPCGQYLTPPRRLASGRRSGGGDANP